MPGLVPEDPYDRFWQQFEIVRATLADERNGEPIHIACAATDRVPDFVYQTGHLLVADADDNIDYVCGRFGAERIGAGRLGVQLVSIGERDVLSTLDELDGERGAGTAAPHHLLSITSDVNLCPADEPSAPATTTALYPPLATGRAGDGVRIEVIDTGLVTDWTRHRWLEGITGGPRLPVPPGEIPIYLGHGTFIAGVLRRVAPKAQLNVSNEFRRAGAITECVIHDALLAILNRADEELPHIISLSAGGTSRHGRALLGLAPVIAALQAKGVLVVAAAGNDGRDSGFWPAALPGVVSVGALREDLTGRACFSNFGGWVSCYAPGERLVNAFTDGRYTYSHEGRETCRYRRRSDPAWYSCCTCVTAPEAGTSAIFDGTARWSGTSFATPIVAGLIAARMTATGDTPRAAADWLMQHPAVDHPDLGPLLLPGQAVE